MKTPSSIRLDILSAAVWAIAASLPDARAHQVEAALRRSAEELSNEALSADTDAALAAEMMQLLNALPTARKANTAGATQGPAMLNPCD